MPRTSSGAQRHPGQDCGPCTLCKQERFAYTHAADLGREYKDRLLQFNNIIPDIACLCKICVDDLKRNVNKCNYTPRWLKVTSTPTQKCAVPTCHNKSRIVQCLLTTEKINEVLKLPSTSNNTGRVDVCIEHYKVIHRSLPANQELYDHSKHKCTVCNKQIQSIRNHRYCPNPELINHHLKNHTDFEGNLDSTTIICRTCHNSHHIILKARESESSDTEMSRLLEELDEEQISIRVTGLDSIVEYSLLSSASVLGHRLLKQWPMLLPVVYRHYCKTFSETADVHKLGIDVSPENVVSPRYLLSYLVTRLGKHLQYTMKQRSAGILLYRRGSDLLLALTKVLHKERSWTCSQTSNISILNSDTTPKDNDSSTTTCVWEEMNGKIHNQIHRNMSSQHGEPFDISTFDLDHWVNIMDKNILKMLAVLIKPKSYKAISSDEVYEDMMNSHSKKLRCFNLACIIMFCANKECSFPLHTLLTDAIESYGGSTELVKIFNRLGVVASKDTHDRYVEYVVTQYQEGNHLRHLQQGMFTIASVDNLDFLQSHAAVYCGDQHRSTHITTIQVVQPKPRSLSETHQLSLILSHAQHQFRLMDTHPVEHQLSLSGTQHQPRPMDTHPAEHQLSLSGTQHHPRPMDTHPVEHQLSLSGTQHHPRPMDTHPVEHQLSLSGTQHHLSLTVPNSLHTKTVFPVLIPTNACLPQETAATEVSLSQSLQFFTPGDIGPPAITPPKMGLKRSNSEIDNPIPRKLKHRARTAKEKGTHMFRDESPLLHEIEQSPADFQAPLTPSNMDLSNFELNECDRLAECIAKHNYFNYIAMKIASTSSSSTMCDLQTYLQRLTRSDKVEQSAYTYLKVINKNADCKETILEALCTLHKELDVGNAMQYLLVAGDYKTYNHIRSLKQTYTEKLKWVIPFPGDFHTLHNYQEALMKIYWDAGLKQIASRSGYRGETLTQLGKCSNFSITTNFFFQVWEAVYSRMYTTFISANREDCMTSEKEFIAFLEKKATEDDNWKFWTSFVLEDCLAFINLYLSVRAGDWNLRVASIKQMAAVFTACDRQHYSKLIPQHLAECAQMPNTTIQHFSKGGFVVSISGRNWHNVSFDEAHEMLINKDLKTAIVRPNAEYMSRLSLFFTHRTKALKNLRSIIDGQKLTKGDNNPHTDFTDKSTAAQKRTENVSKMTEVIRTSSLLPPDSPENKTLRNSFTGEVATPE